MVQISSNKHVKCEVRAYELTCLVGTIIAPLLFTEIAFPCHVTCHFTLPIETKDQQGQTNTKEKQEDRNAENQNNENQNKQ